MGVFKYGNKIQTPAGRLSYPKLFRAEASKLNPNTPKFSTSLIVPKVDGILDPLIQECLKVAQEAFGPWFRGKLSQFKDKQPFKSGDDLEPDNPAFEQWILSANCGEKHQPIICNKSGQLITDERLIYPGAIAILFVQPMAYDHEGIKGIKLALSAVQKIADAEPFATGSGFSPSDVKPVDDVPPYMKQYVTAGQYNPVTSVFPEAQLVGADGDDDNIPF